MTAEKNSFLINWDFNLKQAMKRMSGIGQKVIFVISARHELMGALSDGDIRKWILGGGSLKEKVSKICNKKPKFVHESYSVEDVKKLMLKYHIECVPVIDSRKGVVDVLTWENIFAQKISRKKKPMNVQVIIMAGGKGSRLDPFTRILPKPLLPIGDKPVIEIIMERFSQYGIREFTVTLNHKAKMVKSYFEDKKDYKIHYVEEKKPLGTAGSLRLIKRRANKPFLITNCDVIIESDLSDVVNFHADNDYDMTLVVSCRHFVIPYGVCEIENGGILKRINEKPGYDLLVNTGMYMMKKKVIDLIPKNEYLDINRLIEKAKKRGLKVGVFPIGEDEWVDVGQWDEYQKAIEKIKVTQ